MVGPTEFILRGLFLNTTSQKHHMDLWRVVTPLHRPLDGITLTYGNIISGPDNTRVKVDDLQRAAEVVEQYARNEVGPLRSLQAPAQFLQHIAWRGGSESEPVQLDFALTHFLVGNVSEALRRLKLLTTRQESFPVHRRIAEQALAALEYSPSALQKLIDGWRDANVAAFGLEATVVKRSGLRLV
ncbi:hypothetical protein [Rhodopseudomonas telluris]|uniref:Uncharacterized protein n=1 Tax=Rhodopseudomonas telluris TaxID=644215 RepID=A0ABV6ETC5_9BRAD